MPLDAFFPRPPRIIRWHAVKEERYFVHIFHAGEVSWLI